MTLSVVRGAIYLRLSKDDEGGAESESIRNQRDFLLEYAKANQYPILYEYVDDGYSGTNFDRPGFQKLLSDIEAGKINLLLTKDLSRLGRDYIQTGQYTELYFPAKQVRFIAVNDFYDTKGQDLELAPFKNLVNEMYARDTSRKIKSAFASKMKKGCFIGNFAPYGYRKDPCDKNHLILDPASAKVVCKLFSLAASGEKPSALAKFCNENQVPSPSSHRCVSGSCRTDWTSASVTRILKNPVYLGHMVQGKTTKLSFKSKQILKKDSADWIVVKNTHEPLVDITCFSEVQRRLQSRICEKSKGFSNLFSGLAKCSTCGHAMSTLSSRKKSSPQILGCGNYKLHGKAVCSNHFIDYKVLCHIVLDVLHQELTLTEKEKSKLIQELMEEHEAQFTKKHQIQQKEVDRELFKLEHLIEQIFDDRAEGRLEEEHFYRLLEKYETKTRQLKKRQSALQAEPAKLQKSREKENERKASLVNLLSESICPKELTSDYLFSFLDYIEVDQGVYQSENGIKVKHQKIKIALRFSAEEQNLQYEF